MEGEVENGRKKRRILENGSQRRKKGRKVGGRGRETGRTKVGC